MILFLPIDSFPIPVELDPHLPPGVIKVLPNSTRYLTVTCSCGAKGTRPNALELPEGWRRVKLTQEWVLCPKCVARHERDQVAVQAACQARLAKMLKVEKG